MLVSTFIPSNDFSFYDQMLDTSCLLGNIPPRFQWDGGKVSRDLQFQIARGTGNVHQDCGCGEKASAFASEMTKWFDKIIITSFPSFTRTRISISSTKPVDEFTEAFLVRYPYEARLDRTSELSLPGQERG